MQIRNGTLTYSEYDASRPLINWPSAPMLDQIDAYANQQEWIPEQPKKRKPRESNQDLRRDKCKARYKAQFGTGLVSPNDLCKAFKIQRQSVMLKLREYLALGYVREVENKLYEWVEKA